MAKKVPIPTVRVGDDLELVAARYKAALRKANARIEEIEACERQVRKTYPTKNK